MSSFDLVINEFFYCRLNQYAYPGVYCTKKKNDFCRQKTEICTFFGQPVDFDLLKKPTVKVGMLKLILTINFILSQPLNQALAWKVSILSRSSESLAVVSGKTEVMNGRFYAEVLEMSLTPDMLGRDFFQARLVNSTA